MSVITLTTDFGAQSPYAAAMKGVILSLNPAATIVDITHAIPPQDVAAAAIVIDDITDYFPEETIHVVVVDPGVGTARAVLYAEIGAQRFLAPDNGVLSHVARRFAPRRLLRVANERWFRQPVSNTFHGRDIFAPVAARLSLGHLADELGPPAAETAWLRLPQLSISESRVAGVIQAVDSFGNLITNITADALAGRPTDRRACIVFGIYETWGIYHTYAAAAEGSLIALVDSRGRLEIAIVGDNAAERLGLAPGVPVVVAWE